MWLFAVFRESVQWICQTNDCSEQNTECHCITNNTVQLYIMHCAGVTVTRFVTAILLSCYQLSAEYVWPGYFLDMWPNFACSDWPSWCAFCGSVLCASRPGDSFTVQVLVLFYFSLLNTETVNYSRPKGLPLLLLQLICSHHAIWH